MKIAWESSALSTWEEKLSHSLLRFLILDADEWKFLSNFSNIPKEPWKMAWRDIFQEELLERACEAVTCSSEGMPYWAAMDHGPLLLLPLSCCWTTAAATAASGMPLPWKGHRECPREAGQGVHLPAPCGSRGWCWAFKGSDVDPECKSLWE